MRGGPRWVGLGRIVYATSSAQTGAWLAEWGIPAAPVAALPITTVAPGIAVEGPVPELADEVRELQRRRFGIPPDALAPRSS